MGLNCTTSIVNSVTIHGQKEFQQPDFCLIGGLQTSALTHQASSHYRYKHETKVHILIDINMELRLSLGSPILMKFIKTVAASLSFEETKDG